jgi:uncharacterized protein (TIGR00251 family)
MKYLKIKVTPNAKKNEIIESSNNFMRVKINASPEKGRANKELIKFLAKHLNIKKSAILIKSGEKSRTKIIQIV